MKRTLALTVPLLIFVAVLVPMIAGENGFPTGAQSALDQYLLYRQRIHGNTIQAQLIVHARQPWNFIQDMSAAAIGDSARYRTASGFSGQRAAPSPAPLGTVDVLNESAARSEDQRIPLPYPPEDLWCAQLDSKNLNPTVVFVALHQDLYNGAWIIHEPAIEVDQTLSTIGCAMP